LIARAGVKFTGAVRPAAGGSDGAGLTSMDRITAERRAPFGGSPQVGGRGRRPQHRLLTAALEVFDEVGYQGARIDTITDRAGCSRPTFYQCFAGEETRFDRLLVPAGAGAET
jgi:AcrR family transcriptional regulator